MACRICAHVIRVHLRRKRASRTRANHCRMRTLPIGQKPYPMGPRRVCGLEQEPGIRPPRTGWLREEHAGKRDERVCSWAGSPTYHWSQVPIGSLKRAVERAWNEKTSGRISMALVGMFRKAFHRASSPTPGRCVRLHSPAWVALPGPWPDRPPDGSQSPSRTAYTLSGHAWCRGPRGW